MSLCKFSMPFQIPAEQIAEKASIAIRNAGGSFTGNAVNGIFTVPTPLGTVRGGYEIQGSVIHVAIASKPFFVSCVLIEKQLREYLGGIGGSQVA